MCTVRSKPGTAILPERDHGAGNHARQVRPSPRPWRAIDWIAPPRACSPASIQRHPSGWCSRVRVALESRVPASLVRAGLSTARVMCADCGEPLICVSRTARACVSYLFRRKNAHDISVHSSDMPCTCGDARDGAAGRARRRARAARRRAADGTRGARTGRRRKRATPDHTYTDADSNAHRAHRADGSPRHRATATAARRRRHLRRA